MKLRRVEAVRFGGLEAVSLGDLGPGLTVVLGPNEAGKSTFTALVRSVLYGFPKRSESEAGYESAAGKRQGRLVLADADGEWVVERTEGPHGGPVTVHAVTGPGRTDLPDALTAGVSRDAYRVVFGFGLADLAEIERGRGSGDDVIARLYAARVGLSVSPQDVKAGIEREALDLFKPRGTTPLVNTLKSRIGHLRGELRDLQDRAAGFARERARLDDLVARRDAARTVRDEAAGEVLRLEGLAAGFERLEERESELAGALASEGAAATEAGRQLERVDVDERVLAVAPELEATLAELSGFSARLELLAAHDAAMDELRRRAAAALGESGLGADDARTADIGPDTLAGVEEWRDTLSRLATRAETASAAATQARAAAEAARKGDAQAFAAPGVPGSRLVWLVAIVLGILAAGAGAALGQWVAIVAGVVFALAGLAGLALGWFSPNARSREGQLKASEYEHASHVATEVAAEYAVEYEREYAAWRTWLESRGISGAGDYPAAVAQLIGSLKEWRLLQADLIVRTDARANDEAACNAYAARLAATVGSFIPEPLEDLGSVSALAARARVALDDAFKARAVREGLAAELQRHVDATVDLQARLDVVRAELGELRSTANLAGGSLEARALEQAARQDRASAEETYAVLADEVARLEGELGIVANESRMGELHLQLTAAQSELEAAAEDYAVHAIASRLLELTTEEYERTRQPEVIRIAGEVLERITSGRYTRVAVPSSGQEIKVLDASSNAKTTAELSRGTQEQLYLALRIALIRQLGDVGSGLPVLMDDILVNFDPERRAGAARAVVDLASERQVVFFTCHPETAELFGSIDSGHTVLTLDRC